MLTFNTTIYNLYYSNKFNSSIFIESFFRSNYILIISYLTRALSLRLRLTVNMIDSTIFFKFFYILIIVFLCFIILINILEELLNPIRSFDILLSTFIPVIIYPNADTHKLKIISDNKRKAGTYLWTHLESGKKYIGSSVDLSRRLRSYFNLNYLESSNKMYINRALASHGYSSFSLTILKYIDLINLDKDEIKTIILLNEQHYLDTLRPEYNSLKFTGNSLGYQHSEEIRTKIKEFNLGKNIRMKQKQN
jgi:hypothetical protein